MKHAPRIGIRATTALATLFYVVVCAPVWGETTTPTPPPAAAQQQPQTQQPSDTNNLGQRDKRKKAAQQLDMAAIMAMASCAYLMKKAQDLPPENPMRDILMMQAMQQCAQGAANKDAGDKNDEQARDLTSEALPPPEIPKYDELQKPEEQKTAQAPESTRGAAPTLDTNPLDLASEPLAAFNPSSDNGSGNFALGDLTGTPETNKLNPIPGNNLEFNEDGKTTDPTTPTPSGLGILGTPKAAEGELGAVANAKNGEEEGSGRGAKNKNSGAGSASGGGGSEEGGQKEDFDFAALMGGFLGGGGPELVGASDQVVGNFSANKKSGKSRLNIFQYASMRYRKASYQDGRITPKLTARLEN